MLILTKNDVFYGNFVGNRQTKIFSWKTDKVEMEVSHTFEISMGDKKKKSYGLLKSSRKGGGAVGCTTSFQNDSHLSF